jgi:hypothetical protein
VSPHWRLALWYVAWVCVGAVPVGAAVWGFYGAVSTGAFLYGVGMGAVSFVSMAATVSLLTARTSARQGLGAALFAGRYGFVAGALGIPAYMELWPVAAMLSGFVAVYLAENVVLLPRVSRVLSGPGARRAASVRPGRKRVERRVEV